jgi:hypothetical protein
MTTRSPSSEKRCFKCDNAKPLTDFYKHKEMADGHLNKCKECTKSDVQENYRKRRDYYRAYDQVRNQREERREGRRLSSKMQKLKSADKFKARYAVSKAVRDGHLRPGKCEVCGSFRVQAHHDDYSKPLDVRWLCFAHHREVHGQKAVATERVPAFVAAG